MASMTPDQKEHIKVILTTAHKDYEKGLDARAFFKLQNHETSEDLVQDTFMKTWSYLLKGGKIVLMKAYLYHVLNALIIDEYRKSKSTSLDELVEKGYEPISNIDDFERLLDILEGKDAIVLIERLPLNYQKIMKMRYISDLTISEMSAITGDTENNVSVKMHRALKKLKALYNDR